MKRIKTIFLIVTLFCLSAFLLASTEVLASDITTSDSIYVLGAQVRTSGNAGIRFVATETYEGENETAYGILLSFGEAEADENFVIGGTVNGQIVANGQVDEKNDKDQFFVTLYNVPEAFYDQKVSARAYVVDGDKVVYGTTVTIRSLTDVVTAAYEKGDDSEFVKEVYEASQYAAVKVTYNTDGGFIGRYASVDVAIKDFLVDYNTARKKSHTVESFYEVGSMSEISDASNFLYDTNYRAKWAWLVDYIASVASSANKHAWEVFNNYDAQSGLNAENTNNIYRIAYELRGWVGQAQYTKNANFKTADYSSATVKSAFDAINTFSNVYTYRRPCDLATPFRAGHTFLGWVDSNGNPVTTYEGYEAGSDVSEVTYTATWKANYATVTVNYDANGGALPISCDPNAKTFSKYDNTGGASGTYLCDTSITPKNSLRWQYKVLLQYDALLDAYEVVCLDAAKQSANNAASAAGVTWTHAIASASTNMTSEFTVGQYVCIEGTPKVGNTDISYVVLADAEAVKNYAIATYTTTYMNATTLLVPTKEGAEFVGWLCSLDGQLYTEFPGYLANSGVSEITYTAQWNEPNKTYYTVEYNLDGGEFDGAFFTEFEENNPFTLPTPVKEGYTFLGWYEGDELIETLKNKNYSLSAKWELTNYTITYFDGEEELKELTDSFTINDTVVLPTYEKEGYVFNGWFDNVNLEGEAISSITVGTTGNITLYASFEEIKYVAFIDGQGNLNIASAKYEANHAKLAEAFIADWNKVFGTELNAATAFVTSNYDSPFRKSAKSSGTDATTSGLYKFFNDEEMGLRWSWLLDYIVDELNDENATGNVPCKYQIDVIRGAENTNTSNWYYGYNTVSFIQSIFNAKGTSAGAGQYKFENSPEKLALIANYNNQVEANLEGVELIIDTYVLPEGSAKDGYNFTWGEYEAGTEIEVSGNIYLIATYTPIEYTIKYFDGETELSELNQTFTVEDTFTLPTYEKEHYNFIGWSENGVLVETLENRNYTLTAEWEAIEYTITYYDGEEELKELADTFTIEESPVLATYEKAGYTFLGWSDGDVLVETLENRNYTLTAEWEIKTYTITYFDRDEELNELADTYTIEDTVVLPTYEKDGYTFLGWYDNANFEGDVISVISLGTAGDLTLYASFWTDDLQVNVTYNANGGTLPFNCIDNLKTIDIYSNTGLASGTYLCDTGVIPYNSLRWQYKALLNYDAELDAYEVVCIDAAKLSANDAATAAGVTWTHAISNSGSNITSQYTVGQYIIFENAPAVADHNFNYIVCNSMEEAKSFTLPSTYSAIYTERTDLLVPSKEGAIFAGWLCNLDNKVYTEFPRYNDNPGDIVYTAQWKEDEKTYYTIEYNLDGGEFTSFVLMEFEENKPISLPTPKKEGYEFLGWYENDVLVKKLDNRNYSLTAKWSMDTFTVTYFDGEEELTELKQTFTVEDTVVFATYKKTGYIFIGWYTTSTFEESSRVGDSATFSTNVILYAKFEEAVEGPTTVIFDYNGGVTQALYTEYGTKLTTLVLSSYNGSFWSGTNYQTNTYISNSANDPLAKFSSRIYIGKNDYTGLYTVISIIPNGTASSWPEGAEYVITVSGEYSGTYDDNFSLSKVSVGDVVVIDKTITSISSSALANANFYSETLSGEEITETVDTGFVLPSPKKVGYSFAGWYDDYNNKYETAEDFAGLGQIVVYAKWKYQDHIIGSYKDNSWVVVGNKIQLLAEYSSGANGIMAWESLTPDIASVDQSGFVTGVKEGVATIVVMDAEYQDINFTYYVTVFNETPTGLLGILADSNNSSIYTREDLLIGIKLGSDGAYLTDIIGSVSKLLFTDYVVHDDYYIASPTKTTSYGSAGVEFITVHYAADMPYSANYSLKGGSNLASYNKSSSGSSWHYSVGNDGIWSCQNENKGAWHAGSSKTMTWTATGVYYKAGDPEFAKITLGSDGYFYLNGNKTKVKNTTGYTKLNNMGLGFKIVNGQYYLGGHYYNSSYGYISSTGGNNNSIGMETSVRQGSDLWLTWQYTAQLCAKLLLKYNLPLTQLVGHHFFSGKWCPQPMLEYDLEIWWEFVELTRQQMALYKDYSSSKLTFSSNSQYLNKFGRVTSLPTYSESVKYTVTYTQGSETKTVTLCSILPGSVA